MGLEGRGRIGWAQRSAVPSRAPARERVTADAAPGAAIGEVTLRPPTERNPSPLSNPTHRSESGCGRYHQDKSCCCYQSHQASHCCLLMNAKGIVHHGYLFAISDSHVLPRRRRAHPAEPRHQRMTFPTQRSFIAYVEQPSPDGSLRRSRRERQPGPLPLLPLPPVPLLGATVRS